jgi:hypothetical protein
VPAGLGHSGPGFAEADDLWRDAGGGAGAAVAGSELATPLARQLATLAANVVGWDGSVFDRDAIDFAATFYAELGLRSSVPRAAAVARRLLLQARAEDPKRGQHWHLARVYLGPGGGGPLCQAGLPVRRAAQQLERTFLDKERARVPVASRAAFVGRRRAIQRVLRSFREGLSGVLVHGMGALGKSSLAARVAARTPLEPVLVFERLRPAQAEIGVDHVDVGFMPSEFASALAQRVLEPQALLIAHHLMGRRLPDVDDGPALQMRRLDKF